MWAFPRLAAENRARQAPVVPTALASHAAIKPPALLFPHHENGNVSGTDFVRTPRRVRICQGDKMFERVRDTGMNMFLDEI